MKKREPYKLVVAASDEAEFKAISSKMQSYAQNGHNVPFGYVARFFELIADENGFHLNQLWQESEESAEKALKYLASGPGYELRWAARPKPRGEKTFKPNTKLIFSELIYAFFLYQKDHPRSGKDEAIAFFYWAFEDEYKGELKQPFRDKFSRYKQAVVSGILTMAIGYQLGSGKNLSNREIHQATRHAIKKYKGRQDVQSPTAENK